MGTFAETAIVDYHLLLVNQGIQTSVFRFRLQQKKRKFAVSLFRLQPQIKLPFSVSSIFGIYQHTLLFQYIYTYAALSNGKQIPRQFLLICFRLLIMQMEVCGLSVC